uniref:Uncharacterized protein n=1 Tax=Helianthus annuus TaxID=4232 RepID=A0A251SIM5_HELAN
MLNPILSRGAYSHDFRFLFCLNLRDMMFLILEDREEHKIENDGSGTYRESI